jgi:hypothetical protein
MRKRGRKGDKYGKKKKTDEFIRVIFSFCIQYNGMKCIVAPKVFIFEEILPPSSGLKF